MLVPERTLGVICRGSLPCIDSAVIFPFVPSVATCRVPRPPGSMYLYLVLCREKRDTQKVETISLCFASLHSFWYRDPVLIEFIPIKAGLNTMEKGSWADPGTGLEIFRIDRKSLGP